MSSQAEVEEAIRMYNEKDFSGRLLKVSIARPREDRRDRRGGGGGDRRGGSSRRGRKDNRRDNRRDNRW